MKRARPFPLRAFALLAALGPGCAADDLDEALAGGACKDGKCATGYECVAERCVPLGSGSGGAPADAADDGPCAACGPESCCEGKCVDLMTSSEHCGACAKACLGTVCASGNCTNDCAPGFFDCDGNKANGCEATTSCS